MALNKSQALRLLIIDDSVEAAERIVSTLRNDGIAVRPQRPDNTEELAKAVEGSGLDLVLASLPGGGISPDDVMRTITTTGKDIPVLAVVETVDSDMLASVDQLGIRGCVLREHPQQMLNRIRREWTDLNARRDLRKLEARTRETERRCDALIESSRDPIAYIHEGMHIRANPAYLEMFGFDDEEGTEGISLLDLVGNEQVDELKRMLKALGKGEAAPPTYEVQARPLEGPQFPATISFSTATYEGEPCQQVVFRRRSDNPEMARELEALRQIDQVTGLLNRTTFLHELEQAVAAVANDGQTHGLLLIEPDHYQRMLEGVGLESADLALAALAQRLRIEMEGLDLDAVGARYSDHQFAVLLRNSDHLATTGAADRIREAFASEVFEVGSNSVGVTASIGGVQISERIASINPILTRALANVKAASDVGGNRVELYDAGAMDRDEAERIDAWVARLKDAVANDRFQLHYQPIISLQGDPGRRYECLLRLDNGDPELVQPAAFMTIAEEFDLLPNIDRWVIEHAVKAAAKARAEGKPVILLVKVSQASLLRAEFLTEALSGSLERHGVPAGDIMLELSEAKAFPNLRATQTLISDLAGMGSSLCLEHFGAGVDSFQLLSHLQGGLPGMLKIDRSFIEDISSNAESRERVAQIVERAQELGIQSIAEFVTDASSMTALFSSGIEFVQGAFVAMPGPKMDYSFD